MRRIQNLMEQWLFIGPDNRQEQVNLPHTWNAKDGQDGGNDYYRGTCHYEKTFEKPEFDPETEEVYLEFLGVNASSDVTVNGKELAHHDGGYSTFRINITEDLEDRNKLEVTVDNSVNGKVYPQKADFTFYGGIYRDVRFLIVSKEHFDLDYLGSNGIKITPEVKENEANVHIETFTNTEEAQVNVQIKDQDGKVVAEGNGCDVNLNIQNPIRWHGRKNPYLYTAVATLTINGEVKDEITNRFGIRTFSVDPKKGFFLNGEHYPLHGVSRHQDRQGKGWAISEEDQREDAMLIHEIGATAVRLAHYQHAQSFYDFCDELGMVVWAEIPFISRFINTKEAKEDTVRQMRELIMQNYNHPSICFWGISNEITMGGESDELVENQRILQKLCHKLDPSRKTVLANLTTVESQSEQNKITDLSAYNVYMGWYAGKVEDCGAWMDSLHKENSDMCMGISEYGADTNVQYHSDAPKRQDYTEEYQSYYHEKMLQAIQERPYLWCSFVWNMFDFAADKRKEGGTQGRNTKGLVTYDRKIKKDAFYLYKAYWTEKPFVHICSKRFQKRPGDTTTIKVYATGIEKAELWMDGKRIQEQKGTYCFLFEGIKLTQNHQITIYGYCGDEKVCEDEAAFTHTDGLEAEYILESGENDGVNWFLDEYGEKKKLEATQGFLSVYDEIGTILDTEKGNEILNGLFISFGEGGKALLTESVQNSIRSLTFVELAKMIGPAITPEMLNMLNEQLRHVKNS